MVILTKLLLVHPNANLLEQSVVCSTLQHFCDEIIIMDDRSKD